MDYCNIICFLFFRGKLVHGDMGLGIWNMEHGIRGMRYEIVGFEIWNMGFEIRDTRRSVSIYLVS